MIDVKVFEDASAAKDLEIQSAQAAVDSDAFATQLKQSQALANDLAKKQNAKADIENKKAQFVSIQAAIDTKTQEIADLQQQASDLAASIK